MLKSCHYCGGIHERKYVCKSKPISKKITHVDKFRKTRQWQNKREEICKRDKYLCQVCIRGLYNTRIKYNFEKIQVHHIVPIVKDWESRLDDSNLISLCTYHHRLAEVGKIPVVELDGIVKEQMEN